MYTVPLISYYVKRTNDWCIDRCFLGCGSVLIDCFDCLFDLCVDHCLTYVVCCISCVDYCVLCVCDHCVMCVDHCVICVDHIVMCVDHCVICVDHCVI